MLTNNTLKYKDLGNGNYLASQQRTYMCVCVFITYATQQHSTLHRQPQEKAEVRRRKRIHCWSSSGKVARHSRTSLPVSLPWLLMNTIHTHTCMVYNHVLIIDCVRFVSKGRLLFVMECDQGSS